ncbi:hypothetical protein SSX86_025975 [Deinandra increscens subsp. villosa]|uniref:Protein SCAR n=2 Tax=Deinandra increscens subsp. villosa TaxID=3103831 RepID=A0AAP0CE14_9ASTR
MPMSRYQIRNVYSLANPEVYKEADRDDPEALLEGVAMAGLVGVLRQLGDLAEFAAEIFRDLHEEVMATAARGHGLLVRVQQLESEIPPIERAFLSQTSHSAFFSNSGKIFSHFFRLSSYLAGIDWHPNRQATQNLITTGDLPRFVMDSYEECRGPPRLFLLDKFDVGGAGACLKRYTDPSVFKVEASSDDTEVVETQREKRIRHTKSLAACLSLLFLLNAFYGNNNHPHILIFIKTEQKKGSKWKGGETPEVSQSSHAKLHQLFLEERVLTGATEAARRVRLKKRPNKFPLDSENGESYMNRLNSPSPAHDVASFPSNGSRLEDSNIMRSAIGSPMQNASPCISSRKVAESQPSYADLEVDDNQTTFDDEILTEGLQNGYPSEDVASETHNYLDALATMESEVETRITQGTYSDANKHQLQSQLSDSQSIENSAASNDENNLITISTSTEHISPVGADSPPRPFACIEIPFHPRVPHVADNSPVTQNPGCGITYDTYIDTDKVTNVDHVASLEEGTSKSNVVCSDHTEKLDSPRKSDEHQTFKKGTSQCTSEHLDVLSITDGLSSFSFVKNINGDLKNKYANGDGVLVISDQAEARVLYSSGCEIESDNSEIEPVTVADANTNDCTDYSVLKENGDKHLGDGTNLEQIEADSVNPDMEKSAAVLLPVDVDKHEDNGHSVSEQDSKGSGEKEEVDEFFVISPAVDNPSLNSQILQDQSYSSFAEKDQKQEVVLPDLGSQPVDVGPCVSNVQLSDSAHEGARSSPLQDKVDQSNNQFYMQLSLETEGSQLGSVTQVDHETHIDTPLQELQPSSEFYSVPVSEKPPAMGSSSHDISFVDQGKNQSSSVFSSFGILPQLAPVKPEDAPPLPPLPPMQWRMKKLQNSSSTPTNGGQHNNNHFPPIFPSTCTENSQMVGHSRIDESINRDTENQKSQHDSQMLLLDSSLHTQDNEVIFAETVVSQAAVETHRMPTNSHQEVFWPSSSPYPLPPVLDEMQTNIQPLKVQRPRSPLIDAVATHDKTKLRKVSDRDTTQIPNGEERDTLLDQIRAKSINLKPAVKTRPIIQGPNTNLRVAAILEKANAIRQAFAGSDDDNESDTWSD